MMPVLGGAARRFLVLTAALVAVYFAAAPFFYGSDLVRVLAGWMALAGGTVLTAAGTEATVMGAGIRTAYGGFVVTQECVFTPLIPVYLAGVLSAPLVPWRRALVLAATPTVFFAIGVARVLVLAVPALSPELPPSTELRRPIRVAKRSVRWFEDEVLAWMESRERGGPAVG